LPYGHLSLTAGKNRFPVFAKLPSKLEYMLCLNNMVVIWQIRRQQNLTPENAPGSGMAGNLRPASRAAVGAG